MNTRIEKIIIVHGIGVGTLKKEVHQLLDQYNCQILYISRWGFNRSDAII